MPAHFKGEDRHSERKPDPEPALHVLQFVIGRGIGGDDQGFQRHAADRTAARSGLTDFGMHRTGVDRALIDGCGGRCILGKYFCGAAANLVRHPSEQK